MSIRKFLVFGVGRLFSDKAWIRLKFRLQMKKRLRLKDPKTFNEKLNWLKLYYRRPEYTMMVDKYEAKKYIADKIGSQYVVKNVGGPWQSFDEIDFDALPEQFVLKTTHDCGGVVVCKDKRVFDREKAKHFLEKHLKNKYYASCREWPYKNVKPRIFAEEFMEDAATGELRDYKFFCFDGEAKALFIATERGKEGEEVKFDFFDMDFNHLPIFNGHPNAKIPPEKPQNFEQMKQLAGKLSEGIPHVRVDFYEANGKAYVGELTFCHFGGFVPFKPEEWDYIFGSWIKLPKK